MGTQINIFLIKKKQLWEEIGGIFTQFSESRAYGHFQLPVLVIPSVLFSHFSLF